MGFFSFTRKAIAPYDTLTKMQQHALYFILEYFSKFATERRFGFIKHNALTYLEKASIYLGLSKKEITILRPYNKDIEELYLKIRDLPKSILLDYMINNCNNLVILAEGENHILARNALLSFWSNFGYTVSEIDIITRKYRYRTDI